MQEHNLGEIEKKVLSAITPKESEIREERLVAEKAMKRILSVKGKHVRAVLAGSLARNTHLRGDKDIDLFVMFPKELPRKEFEKEGLRVAKKAFAKTKWQVDYGEHPYLKTVFLGHELEVVPSYDVRSASEKQSAVDRSPFHNAYLLSRMGKGQEGEIRLLKKFMKGIGCYGAELKTRGFSGYLCELLVLANGTFAKTLEAARKWKSGTIIDIEKQWKSKKELAKKFPRDSLIVIDPTDRNRNVAAAVDGEKFSQFRKSAKEFLSHPSTEFFFPKEIKQLSKKELWKRLEKRKLLVIAFPHLKAHEDVIYGQLRKGANRLKRHLEMHEFKVKKYGVFSDEKTRNAIVFELEKLELPEKILRRGPPESMKGHAKAFIEKHKKHGKHRVIDGRIHVEIPRKHVHAKSVGLEFAFAEREGGKSWLEKCAKKGFAIWEGFEAAELAEKPPLSRFVSTFLME
ncbi:MAG: CCA tRNA nucleotidyltransferase [archaeon]